MNIRNIINGCNFQSIADHVIDLNNVNEYREYRHGNIIYCKTDFLGLLFSKIADSHNSYILITHQSDYEINKEIFDKKPHCIKKWFAQNANYQHPDLIPIPIGLENHFGPSKGAYTDFAFLESLELINHNQRISNKIYCNFSLNTHPNRRNVLEAIQANDTAYLGRRQSYQEYWNEASNFLYIASPRGNGIDCHRTWETLMMGNIPIVEKHPIYDSFGGLPIVQIENWSDLKELKEHDIKSKPFANINSNSPCLMSFWKEKIENARLTII